ncbi:MAG: LamG domain-containing protein [candidate division KSB1 bacterium]|nr:LamG domain-containing protein [candidate division KSB1 bacterium]
MAMLFFFSVFNPQNLRPQTVALWLFDEPQGVYPSSVLSDSGPNDYPLVLGLGGRIVAGKNGNALEPLEYPEISIPEGEIRFGLKRLPPRPDRTVPPLSWHNAQFCALMTRGENHLRKQVGFAQATSTRLNLGDFDWTVEFWFLPTRSTGADGVVFEIGEGPRGDNPAVTCLRLAQDFRAFVLENTPSGQMVNIPTDAAALQPGGAKWHHLAFVYSAARHTLRHFVDGRPVAEVKLRPLQRLKPGEEDYMSIGRDGRWRRPLQGRLDELHVFFGQKYRAAFQPTQTLSPRAERVRALRPHIAGPPLLFAGNQKTQTPVRLGSRKYLLIDDALIEKMENITFAVNPPRVEEVVIDSIRGPFRKHLTVVEDDSGRIRIYNSVEKDYLQVLISTDGIHFTAPDLGREYFGRKNIVIPAPVGGLGTPFLDPNGPSEERWKYISDFHRRGIYLFVSPDGLHWKRHSTYVLPFRSGTQSCAFYDDQQQKYLAYHRTDVLQFPGGETRRETAFTESESIYPPWPFRPLSPEQVQKLKKKFPLRDPQPWFLDNGPLTPGGFSFEYPHLFTPVDTLDPADTDIYVTKAIKYPWAPDVYLAFPIVYFHYEVEQPAARRALMDSVRGRGSGPIETQLAVSRDGFHWRRYPRPAYVGIGRYGGRDIKTAYLAQGMVRRGDEIWQYFFAETQYHSAWIKRPEGRAVFRVVQRLDGFVSADAPYDRVGRIVTRPLIFRGDRLRLNIDTDAAGYAQVGILDENGKPFPGYSVEECVYINGDAVAYEVEWLQRGSDVSALAGKVVRLDIRLRGARLYALQFGNGSGQIESRSLE